MIVLYSIIIGVVAGLIDGMVWTATNKINHYLHAGARVLALAIALYFTVGFGWDSIAYLGIMGITFRLSLNFFMGKTWDYIGTTAWYDRAVRWVGSKFDTESGMLAYALEAFIVALAFIFG